MNRTLLAFSLSVFATVGHSQELDECSFLDIMFSDYSDLSLSDLQRATSLSGAEKNEPLLMKMDRSFCRDSYLGMLAMSGEGKQITGSQQATLAEVPEPTSLTLMITGVIASVGSGLTVRRRRHKLL